MILDAEEKELEIPKISINFPPNFLEVNLYLYFRSLELATNI